ncbi:hypothetical protein [Actinoplanes subglobosus]|uniref:Uncharacterized protein n=1 Tax=Actinoplanes subglobosus TaxID=1547892 RepID=A0ABV8IS08_9ACTN
MNEQGGSPTPRQVVSLLIAGAFFLAFMIQMGMEARERREDARADGTATERQAEALRALLADPGIYARDANPLNKSAGQGTHLHKDTTEWLVTPSKAGPGAAAPCDTGPHVTVDLTVETVAGADTLPMSAFLLLTPAGPTPPVVACSTGFGGTAQARTLVFAADGYDRLIVGTDPADPEVSWQLG